MKIIETPYNSTRIFLYRDKLPKNGANFSMLLVVMDSFSICGAADLITEEYMSWEFMRDIPNELIALAAYRNGYERSDVGES